MQSERYYNYIYLMIYSQYVIGYHISDISVCNLRDVSVKRISSQ